MPEDCYATPEDLIRSTKQVTLATAKAVGAGNSCKQEDIIAASNVARQAVFEMINTCRVSAIYLHKLVFNLQHLSTLFDTHMFPPQKWWKKKVVNASWMVIQSEINFKANRYTSDHCRKYSREDISFVVLHLTNSSNVRRDGRIQLLEWYCTNWHERSSSLVSLHIK